MKDVVTGREINEKAVNEQISILCEGLAQTRQLLWRTTGVIRAIVDGIPYCPLQVLMGCQPGVSYLRADERLGLLTETTRRVADASDQAPGHDLAVRKRILKAISPDTAG